MSNSCGEIRFLEGGTIKDATIVSSSMVNSSISNSTVESSTITNSTVDGATANAIISAIAQLSISERRVLVDALLSAMLATAEQPDAGLCASGNFPAVVLGGSDYALGRPDGWVVIGGGLVPVYQNSCADE